MEMKLRPRVAVVGAGRAGSALAVALQRAGYAITAVASRNPASASFLAARCGARPVGSPLAAVRAADITLLTVPDGALPGVAATIASSGAALRGRGVVHTAARLSARA